MILTITIARKPLAAPTVAANVLKWRTGGLNIDESRIRTTPRTTHKGVNKRTRNKGLTMREGFAVGEYRSAMGRWPANLILSHLSGCQKLETAFTVKNCVSKVFHGGYESEASTGFLNGVSHPGNQHGEDVVSNWLCSQYCAIQTMGLNSGNRPGMGGGGAKDQVKKPSWTLQQWTRKIVQDEWRRFDNGPASRFFKQVQEEKD